MSFLKTCFSLFIDVIFYFQNQLKYDIAKEWHFKCIDICKSAFGTNHLETLQAINKLAYLYEIQGEFEVFIILILLVYYYIQFIE